LNTNATYSPEEGLKRNRKARLTTKEIDSIKRRAIRGK
jgi:hypothetical protein